MDSRTMSRADFLLLTTDEETLHLLLETLQSHQKVPPSPIDTKMYYQAQMFPPLGHPGRDRYDVVITMLHSPGRLQAMEVAGDAIRRFRPRYILLIGPIRSMDKSIYAGDILVGDQIVDYEMQNIKRSKRIRNWEIYRSDARLLIAVKNFKPENPMISEIYEGNEILKKRPATRHVGSLLSGDKEISIIKLANDMKAEWGDAIGIDSDSSGVYAAAHNAPEAIRPGVISIRAANGLLGVKFDHDLHKAARRNIIQYVTQFLSSMPVPFAEQSIDNAVSKSSRYKTRLLNRMRSDWLNGVLSTITQGATLNIDYVTSISDVHFPWKQILKEADHPMMQIPPGLAPIQLFRSDAIGEELLILGEPGSGKTAMLLIIANSLLRLYEQKSINRIPLILSLSSWSGQNTTLEEWILLEIKNKYGIPEKIAKRWLQHELLIPFLDELDCVPKAQQVKCIDQINQYLDKHRLSGIVVCCRTLAYTEIGKRLNCRGAIRIKPLNNDQITCFLAENAMTELDLELEKNPGFREIARSPLMLKLLMRIFRENHQWFLLQSNNSVEKKHINRMQTYIVEQYIRCLLDRRSLPNRYSIEKIMAILSWISRGLVQTSRSEICVENFGAIPFVPKTSLVGIVTFVATVLLCIPCTMAFFGVVGGAFLGLLLSVGFTRKDMTVIESIRWAFPGVREVMDPAWKFAALAFIVFSIKYQSLFIGIGNFIVTMLVYPVIILIQLGIQRQPIPRKRYPNEGVHRTLINSVIAGILTGFAMGAFLYVVGRTLESIFLADLRSIQKPKADWLAHWPAATFLGVSVTCCMTLAVALNFGLKAVFQHYTARLFLWLDQHVPLRFVQFMNYLVDMGICHRIGGSYTFQHSLLSDYFAGFSPRQERQAHDK